MYSNRSHTLAKDIFCCKNGVKKRVKKDYGKNLSTRDIYIELL